MRLNFLYQCSIYDYYCRNMWYSKGTQVAPFTYEEINIQNTGGTDYALSRLGQAGKGSGHQPVADLKLTAIGRKYKTVAGVLIYRA